MKLYIKQHLFSFNNRYDVLDENEQLRFRVEGKLLSVKDRFHIYDASGNEVLYMEQELWHLTPHYKIINMNGNEILVKKEFTFFKAAYTIEGTDWKLQGDIWGHEYEVISGNEMIMSVSKQWMTLRDTYELNIQEDSNAALCLAIVIVIDACIDARQNSN